MSDNDPVPLQTEFREGVQKACEGNGSITLEDATLDEMREADIHVISSISSATTSVDYNTGQQSHETRKGHGSFQLGENC